MWYPLQKTCAVALLLCLLAITAAGCATRTDKEGGTASAASSSPDAPAASQPAEVPNQVTIDNFSFKPPQMTVSAGTRVTWVNHDDVPHTATSTVKPRLFDSGTLDTDDRFEHVFTTPGTYDYYCALHPKMTGQIIVK